MKRAWPELHQVGRSIIPFIKFTHNNLLPVNLDHWAVDLLIGHTKIFPVSTDAVKLQKRRASVILKSEPQVQEPPGLV
jgi:hypothetical protein